METSRSALVCLRWASFGGHHSERGGSLDSRPLAVWAGFVLTMAVGVALLAAVTSASPAQAAQADQVVVRAQGRSGAELVELHINGEIVADWVVTTEAVDYVFTFDEDTPLAQAAGSSTVDVESVEVRFINDAGTERDLRVDYVDIAGTIIESENSATTSTGTFTSNGGCAERSSVSDWLHCNGSFFYAVGDGVALTMAPERIEPVPDSAIDVRIHAMGRAGTEVMELEVNGEVVAEWTTSIQPADYNFSLEPTTIESLEVRFVNDRGIERDLRVDYIEIDGTIIESENPANTSTGTFSSTGGCTERASISDWLHCNGSFSYALGLNVTTPRVVEEPGESPASEPSTTQQSTDEAVETTPEQVPPTQAPVTTTSTTTTTTSTTTTTTQAPSSQPSRSVGTAGERYSIAEVIDGTISSGDGSNPNEESPMGRHDAPLALSQGWNWAQGPTRNSVWGQLGSGGSQYAEFRCAVIPELGHTPGVPFRINVRNGAYYQFANGDWQTGFDVDLTGGNHGGYLGTAGGSNTNPFNSGSHGLIDWRREADGSFSAPWNPNALMMHFWAAEREAPAPGQTAEFLTSEIRLQQPDGQTVDLSQVHVLFQCGVDYYSTTGGQGTQVPGPGIGKYHRATEYWQPSLWVTLPNGTSANSVGDFTTWLENNTPPQVG